MYPQRSCRGLCCTERVLFIWSVLPLRRLITVLLDAAEEIRRWKSFLSNWQWVGLNYDLVVTWLFISLYLYCVYWRGTEALLKQTQMFDSFFFFFPRIFPSVLLKHLRIKNRFPHNCMLVHKHTTGVLPCSVFVLTYSHLEHLTVFCVVATHVLFLFLCWTFCCFTIFCHHFSN